MADSATTDERPESRDPLRRLALTLALGVAAFLLNKVTFPILTEESPEFLFGGGVVLVAFVRLGIGPGLAVGVISLGDSLLRLDPIGLAALVYLLESCAAVLLLRWTGSLVLSVFLFWFTLGWLADLWLYGAVAGFESDYLYLLYLKQIFNGALNAVGAEAILAFVWRRGFGPAERPAMRDALTRSTALLVVIPTAVLGLMLTRSQLSVEVAQAETRMSTGSIELVRDVQAYVREHVDDLGGLARLVERDIQARDSTRARARMREHLRARGEYYNVGWIGTEGRRVYDAVETGDEEPFPDDDLSDRPYFVETQKTLRFSISPLILGNLSLRYDDRLEPILFISQPLFGPDSDFAGVVYASIDVMDLERLTASFAGTGVLATIIDAEGKVVFSSEPHREPGTPISDVVPGGLEVFGATGEARYFPADGSPEADGLGVNQHNGVLRPIGIGGLRLLMELPAPTLHAELAPLARSTAILFLLAVVLASLLARFVSGRLVAPLLRVNNLVAEVAGGRFPRPESFATDAPVREITDMTTRLGEMSRALEEARRGALRREVESEERFHATFHQTAVGIAHVDLSGTVVRMNGAFSEFLGLSLSRVLGRSLEELVHPDDLEKEWARFNDLVVGHSDLYRAEIRLRSVPRGRWVQVAASVAHNIEGHPSYVIYVAQDIEDRRRLSAELADFRRMESIGRLAGGMAHRINNALAPALNAVHVLRPRQGDPTSVSSLEAIEAAIRHSSDLTRELLTIGGKQLVLEATCDVSHEVEAFELAVRAVLHEDHPDFELVLDLAEDLPNVMMASEQLQIVLGHLFDNAVEAAPEGRVRIGTDLWTAEDGRRPAEAAGLDAAVRLTVEDDGYGIPEDLVEFVFDPFVTTKSAHMGAGLGLATVYGIVRQHGGRVWLDSTPDVGTRATVLFPLRQEE